MNWNARTRSETTGYTLADTRAPYHAQYLLNFQLVNATGVPVFRTRHVAVASPVAPASLLASLATPSALVLTSRGRGLPRKSFCFSTKGPDVADPYPI